MKAPWITYINGTWALCWMLYHAGVLTYTFMPLGSARGYKVYNWCMTYSCWIQEASGCNGPWSKLLDE